MIEVLLVALIPAAAWSGWILARGTSSRGERKRRHENRGVGANAQCHHRNGERIGSVCTTYCVLDATELLEPSFQFIHLGAHDISTMSQDVLQSLVDFCAQSLPL